MIDLVLLIWRFLAGQPVAHAFRLFPWHLTLLLFVLGLLAGFGLHFLLGHVLGFYRRKGRLSHWIAIPSGVVLLVAVQLLLGAYLLGTRAPELAALNLSERLEGRLGEMLLAPAFIAPPLSDQPEDAVAGSVLRVALLNSPEAEYRARLQSLADGPSRSLGTLPATLPDPSRSVPNTPPGHPPLPGSPPDSSAQAPRLDDTKDSEEFSPIPNLSINEWRVARMGLRWVAAPHRTWLSPLQPFSPPDDDGAKGDQQGAQEQSPRGAQGDDGAFFLPEFLLGLINEVPPDAVLSREDWEHVAGTRFVGGYVEPLLVEYLSYLALTLALLVVLVLAAYAYLMRKLKRIGLKKSKEKQAAEGKDKAGKDGSTADSSAGEVSTATTPITVPAPAASDLPVTADSGIAPIPGTKASDSESEGTTEKVAESPGNTSLPESSPTGQPKP